MPNTHLTGDSGGISGQLQILVGSDGDRRGLQELLDDHYDVVTGDTVQPADGYLVDSESCRHYSDALRQRKADEFPAFCPALLVQTDKARIPDAFADVDTGDVSLVNDVMEAPLDPPLLHRRLQNLLVRRDQSLELARENEALEAWFEALFRGIPDPAFVLEDREVFVEVNEAFYEETGVSRGVIQSTSLDDLENFGLASQEVLAQVQQPGDSTDADEAVVPYVDADGVSKYGLLSLVRETVAGETFIIGILSDITEHKSREEQLQTANEQLEVLNRILRHDIRNDVNVLQLWGEQLSEEVADSHEPDIQRILTTVEHIRSLTEDSRDFIRAIATDEVVGTEPTRLDTVVEDELEKARSRYRAAEFTVANSLPTVCVTGNELLTSVVRNILDNAVQHNRNSVRVTVSVAEDQAAGVACLAVADDGRGVPDSLKDKMFSQGTHGLESEGTGIGLHVVHRAVKSYGGTIRVEDNDPTGSVFVIELPTECGNEPVGANI